MINDIAIILLVGENTMDNGTLREIIFYTVLGFKHTLGIM